MKVSKERAMSLPSDKGPQQTAPTAAANGVEREIAAYEEKRQDLETRHTGKWVLFQNQQLVSIYDSFQAAANDAVRRFGRGPYLIRQVGAPPMVLPASVM